MNASTELKKYNPVIAWLFNPFTYIAGRESLIIGLIGIVATSLIGSLGDIHFDGVLDMHIGAKTPVWFFIAEGFINWFSFAVLLFIAGRIFSKSAFRIVDVFGTQAFCRLPTLISAAALLLPANKRVLDELTKMVQNPNQLPALPLADTAIFAAVMIIVLVMLVWMVTLMYRAYAVSCNLKGTKAIISFIVCLVIAEVISKTGIFVMIKFMPQN
ncbi:MAG: hypothetical protein NT011_13700 [Kiritimatiellaeota bacterium]|nr:hypothetical protein [Kiritimatiellota bacterium]